MICIWILAVGECNDIIPTFSSINPYQLFTTTLQTTVNMIQRDIQHGEPRYFTCPECLSLASFTDNTTHAVAEIPTVIRLLTQSVPSVQKETIERYFTPSASFTHPFCRTGSFDGSRWLVLQIYRFYKIMSPGIEIEVKSASE